LFAWTKSNVTRVIQTSIRLISFSLLLISGCAVLPDDAPPYEPAPAPDYGNSTVYFYRHNAYPLLIAPAVYINDNIIFKPSEKAYTWVHVKQGNYKIRIDWGWEAGAPDLAFNFDIALDRTYYFKISGDVGPHPVGLKVTSSVFLLEESVAKKDLMDFCRYIPAQTQYIE
jgi:hypothetical protein